MGDENRDLNSRPGLRAIFAFRGALLQLWTSPLLVTFLLAPSRARALILADAKRWLAAAKHSARSEVMGLLWLLANYREFRNLYYYRLRKGSIGAYALAALLKLLYRDCSSLFIYVDDLGPGLMIRHGFSTIIDAKSIGENCRVYQQVTIGYNGASKRPTIGNNVTITAGAKVVGDITIGDNVMVGANAVVVKSVPSDCTVVGVPAHIVKRNGVRVNEPLV